MLGEGVHQKLVKSNTIGLPERAVNLILKPLVKAEVGAAWMLVHISISIENRSPPVDRIVSLQASLCCMAHAGTWPNSQVLSLKDIFVAHRSYRCFPVLRDFLQRLASCFLFLV